MLKCPSCGKDISEYATTCPNCGADLKSGNKVPKTEKAITMQRQDRKKKQANIIVNIASVSYTHLDVYKRQPPKIFNTVVFPAPLGPTITANSPFSM